MHKKELLFSALLFFFLTSVLLWQMLVKGMYLFPGDYLMAWFEPYKSEHMIDGNILIPHKPVNDDVFRHIYPFQTLAVHVMKQGQLPTWNPYNGAGMPLLATLNSGMIDPSNILYFLFPRKVTWNMTLFLQFVMIGFFTYLYTRTLHFGKIAAIFSAVAYMLSGFAIARVSFGIYGFAIAALPLLLFVIERYFTNNKTKHLFWIPLVFFFLISSTQPPISFYILVFVTLYFLSRVTTLSVSLFEKGKLLIAPALFAISGILLSAIQILPTLKLLQHANFSRETSEYIEKFLVPIQHLISIGIPNYFGNSATYNFWGQADYVQTVASIGLIPCFFAFVYLFFNKNHPEHIAIKRIFGVTILITCLLAVASPLSKFILTLPIPFLSTDPPSRIFLLTTFAIAILAGAGIDTLTKVPFTLKEKILGALPFLLILSGIIIGTASLYFSNTSCNNITIPDCYQIAFRNTILETGVFGIGLLLFLFATKRTRSIISIFLIIIIFAIGFYNAQKFLPFSSKENFLPESPFIQTLQQKTTDGRVFGFGDATIATNLATFFRFYGPQYYHPLYIKRYGELTAYGNYGTLEGTVLRSDAIIRNELILPPQDEKRREKLLNLLNVLYVIYPGKAPEGEQGILWSDNFRYIKKNEKALPRSFVVQNILVENIDAQILPMLFNENFDPKTTVIVEKDIPYRPTNEKLISSVHVEKLAENSVTIKTTTSTESILILLDNYYPSWNAYIDGKQTPVYRANYTFRAIILPEGDHTVVFRYQPTITIIGLFITAATGLILLILFLLYPKFFKNKKHSHS